MTDDLYNSTKDNTDWLLMDGLCDMCKVIDVYDVDTITIVVKFNGKNYKKKCRLTGIDGAELRTKNLDEKKWAIQGKSFLSNLIMNKILWIKCGKWDKYGRLLGTFYNTKDDMEKNISINRLLVDKGFAYNYEGKTKKKFADWHITEL